MSGNSKHVSQGRQAYLVDGARKNEAMPGKSKPVSQDRKVC